MNKFKKVMIFLVFTCMSSNVIALPFISGSLDMTGAAQAYDANGVITSDAAQATSLKFLPGNTAGDTFKVVTGTGDLIGLDDQTGIIKDFTFAPTFSGQIVDFWKIDIFSFALTSVTRDTSNDPTSILVLNGTGVLSASSGFADTFASWEYTGDTSGSGIFSWNAENKTNVPEPSVLVLLSLGLFGFALRKKI
ncbi:MAG: PEP-CTERM sorting domain-containing protein [Sulfurovum sp.]|nr:PEP-CTERM sorting domain-containing protein [Sulfurovum sp.]NNJ44516.1 PEP-CTERM sorting domain-containing protein [Sulfurovum sp.]